VETDEKGDENIVEVQWVDIETAEQRMPYYRNGISGFLKQKCGVSYTMERG
jgi:8-oxo-dGTP diphosphatase